MFNSSFEQDMNYFTHFHIFAQYLHLRMIWTILKNPEKLYFYGKLVMIDLQCFGSISLNLSNFYKFPKKSRFAEDI